MQIYGDFNQEKETNWLPISNWSTLFFAAPSLIKLERATGCLEIQFFSMVIDHWSIWISTQSAIEIPFQIRGDDWLRNILFCFIISFYAEGRYKFQSISRLHHFRQSSVNSIKSLQIFKTDHSWLQGQHLKKLR